MTNELKRQLLSVPFSTTATEQPSLLENTFDESYPSDNGKQKARDAFIQSNSDHSVDVCLNLKGDMKQNNGTNSDIHHHERDTPHSSRQQLPNEVVSLIISHLSEQHETLYECALVTKQFHMIANPLLWQVPNYSNGNYSERFPTCISDASSQRLVTIGQHIRELHLCGPHWTDAQLTHLLPYVPNLTHLFIQEGYSSPERLPYYCHGPTSNDRFRTNLTRLSLSAIGQHCHRLCHFECTLSHVQSPEWLEMLTPCPLEHLKISSYTPLNEKVMTTIKGFGHLTSLDITENVSNHIKLLLTPTTRSTTITTTTTNDNTNHSPPSLDNNHAAVSLWPQLTNLHLNPCDDIDDASLLCFIKSHLHLQEIHLVRAMKLTDAILDTIAVWLPNIERVALIGNAHISPDGVRRFLVQNSLPNLVLLELIFCKRVFEHHFPETTDEHAFGIVLDRKAIEKIKQVEREQQ